MSACATMAVVATASVMPHFTTQRRTVRSTALRAVTDIEAALGQQILDLPQAQVEAEVQPESMLNDTRQKMMAGIGDLRQAPNLLRNQETDQHVLVTMPLKAFSKGAPNQIIQQCRDST